MLITVIAVLCSISNPTSCHEELVTNSNLSEVTSMSCPVSEAALADWMKTKPQYTLMGWKCVMGQRGKDI